MYKPCSGCGDNTSPRGSGNNKHLCITCHRARALTQAEWTNTVARESYALAGGFEAYNKMDRADRMAIRSWVKANLKNRKSPPTNATSLNYDRDDTDYLYPGLEDRRAERVRRYAPVDREDQEKAKDGLIYVITNPAWPGYCKIGETTDLKKRLSQFQTSSPHRDYWVAFYLHVEDRKAMEKAVHAALIERDLQEKGEWFRINQWHAENLIYKVKRDSQKETGNAYTSVRHRGQRVSPCRGHGLADLDHRG